MSTDTHTQQKQPREGHYQDLELLNIAHQKYVVCIPFIEVSKTVVIITGIIRTIMCLIMCVTGIIRTIVCLIVTIICV